MLSRTIAVILPDTAMMRTLVAQGLVTGVVLALFGSGVATAQPAVLSLPNAAPAPVSPATAPAMPPATAATFICVEGGGGGVPTPPVAFTWCEEEGVGEAVGVGVCGGGSTVTMFETNAAATVAPVAAAGRERENAGWRSVGAVGEC